MEPSSDSSRTARASWLWPALVALVVRVPVTFLADDQFGDAPVRLEVAARLAQARAVGWDFSWVYQYGPLPMHLAALLAAAGAPLVVAARTVALAGGVASVALGARLAGRFSGPRAALAAGLALALSPLHVQASTTFVSEGVYLAFALACLWFALDRQLLACALMAFGASTSRYDAWLWLPLLGAWWVWGGVRSGRIRRLFEVLLFGLGPATILLANGLASGDPLAPLRFIAREHVQLAARAVAEYGAASWRVSMLGYWPAAMAGILTPGFALALFPGLVRALKARSQALVPVASGLLPPALYTVKSVLFGTFWPMARFALGPATLLVAAMPALRTRTLVGCVVAAVATDAALVFEADGLPGLGLVAAASSPVSRLPADLRAAADAIRAFDGVAALDAVATYDDILVACASGRDRWNLEHPAEGVVPGLVVTLDGGAWDRLLTETGHAFGARYLLERQAGRARMWRRAPPDR